MHNGHPANWKQQTKHVLDGGLHHYISHTKMTPWNNRVILDYCYLLIRVLLRISGIIKIAVPPIPTMLQSFFFLLLFLSARMQETLHSCQDTCFVFHVKFYQRYLWLWLKRLFFFQLKYLPLPARQTV